jgi:hypothetical protein
LGNLFVYLGQHGEFLLVLDMRMMMLLLLLVLVLVLVLLVLLDGRVMPL